MPDCIDLGKTFGDRYRVTYEASYLADLGKGVHRGDPWLQVIECTAGRGHFFPWGGAKLAVSVDRPGIAQKIMRLACCTTVQDGSDGCTCTFDVGNFDMVAQIMKPKRRRKFSAEHRTRSTQRLEAWREQNQLGHRAAGPRESARAPTKIFSQPQATRGVRSLG